MVIIITITITFCIAGLHIYLQSNKFKNAFEDYLTEEVGKDIIFSGPIRVKGYLGPMEIIFPNIFIKEYFKKRKRTLAKISQLKVPLSYELIRSGGKSGKLRAYAEQVTISVRGREEIEEDEIDMAVNVQNILRLLSPYTLAIFIDELIFIHTNHKDESIFRKTKNAVINKNLNEYTISTTTQDEAEEYNILAIFNKLDWSAVPLKAKGRINVTLDESKSEYKLRANNVSYYEDNLFTSFALRLYSNTIKLSNTITNYGGGVITGSYSIRPLTRPLKFSANVDIDRVDLGYYFDKYYAFEESGNIRRKRIFPNSEIEAPFLKNMEGAVDVELSNIKHKGVEILNGNATMLLSKGRLVLRSNDLSILDGNGYLIFIYDQNTSKHSVEVNVKLSDMDLSILNKAEVRLAKNVEAGNADLKATIAMKGNTPKRLVTSMGGTIKLVGKNIIVDSNDMELMDTGILEWGKGQTKNITEYFQSKKESSKPHDATNKEGTSDGKVKVECAQAFFNMENGYMVTDRSIILETVHNTIYSSGVIDFNSEELGFTINTKSRVFDITASPLLEYFTVSGTLSDPEIILNKGKAAKQGILTAVGILMGPVPSIVSKTIDLVKDTVNENPVCIKDLH